MKRFSLAASLLAAAAAGMACAGPAPDTEETEAVADTEAVAEVQQPLRPDTTIMISRVGNQIVVEPDSIGVARRTVVRWAAADTGALWVVVFAGGTPMAEGDSARGPGGRVRVFHSGGPGNSDRARVRLDVAVDSVFKYWVFYPDGNGGYLQLDPKLIIIDDRGADSTTVR